MSLYFNGIEIPNTGDVTFGGISFNEVRFNGITYWTKGSEGPGTPPSPSFCDASDTLEERILIRWGYSGLGVGYKVYKGDTEDGTYEVIADIVNGDMFYEDLDVIKDQVYWYYVEACSLEGGGCSVPSEKDSGVSIDKDCSDCAPQTAPFELLASDAVYADRIILTWKNGDIDPLVNNINVYRDGLLLDVVPYPDNNYIDHAVSELETHDYYLAYRNNNGIGPYSNEDEGSTKAKDECYPPCHHTHNPDDINNQGHFDSPPVGGSIDADKLDGKHGSQYADSSHTHTCTEVGAPCGSWSFDGTTLWITIS